jgi:hypothetical protein
VTSGQEWIENHSKGMAKRSLNLEWQKNHTEAIRKKCAKPIMCIETGVVYRTNKEAAQFVGRTQALISLSARKGIPANGYHFRYLTPEEIALMKQDCYGG